ncbi:MAG TPA: universal stress protein [Candidatus Nitrosotalea sp.]|nr:universal stress protein [Candidatus Nitrosotalea sp.]
MRNNCRTFQRPTASRLAEWQRDVFGASAGDTDSPRDWERGFVSTQTEMDRTIKNILVPTDFSPCSAQALAKAIRLAWKCGASVTLLHVVDLNLHLPPSGPANAERLREELWRESRVQLGQTVWEVGEEEVEIQTLIREGLPWEETALAARDCDLIVIGHHKRNRFRELFSRHTVKRVIDAAPCPVLVIGEQQEKMLFRQERKG